MKEKYKSLHSRKRDVSIRAFDILKGKIIIEVGALHKYLNDLGSNREK